MHDTQNIIRILAVDDESSNLEIYNEIIIQTSGKSEKQNELDDLKSELFGKTAPEKASNQYELTLCHQGEEAIESVSKAIKLNQQYAIAFLDVRMPPGIDGIQTAVKIRNLDPDIELVLVTGYSDINPDQFSKLILPAHKLLYLQKPIHLYEVKQIVTSLSAKWKMEKKLLDFQVHLESKIEKRTSELEIVNARLRQDACERAKIESDLKKSEEMYRTLAHNINEGLMITNKEYFIQFINPKLLEQTGYQKDEVLNKPSEIFFKGEDLLTVRKEELKRLEGFSGSYEVLITAKNGRKFPVKISVKPIIQNGIFQGSFVVLTDITKLKQTEDALKNAFEDMERRVEDRTAELQKSLKDLKKAQNQLIQTERMASLGNMVAGVAHEINTPIGICVTECSFLVDKSNEIQKKFQDNQLTEAQFQSYLQIISDTSLSITRNLARSGNLINNFKQVAVNQYDGEQQTFNVKKIIESILLNFKLNKTNHTIKINCSNEMVISSYPDAFSQIISNLLTNTILHGFESIEKGEIEIDVSNTHNILLFTFKDNGVGMDQQTRKQIFDPFFTTKRNRGGIGLGMHIVYNLVTQKLNGQIFCFSDVDKGTEYLIKMSYKPVIQDIT